MMGLGVITLIFILSGQSYESKKYFKYRLYTVEVILITGFWF